MKVRAWGSTCVVLAVILVLLAGSGCSGKWKIKKNYNESDWNEYRNAVPDAPSLTLSLPESNGKGLGDLAVYYDYTVDFTRDVNEHVLAILSWIDEITSYPPSGQHGAALFWGPWIGDGLSPVEALYVMTKVGDRTYDYVLSWRPKNTDDDWTPIWSGHVVASTDTARRGVGNIGIDFTAARSLDPTIDPQGQVAVTYDTVSDGREIQVRYIGFYDAKEDMGGPLNGTYSYHTRADNTGEFLFDWWQDIHWDQYRGTQYAKLEHSWFNTRWHGDGAGRSDVLVTDGDLPDMVPPIARIEVSECWGSDFLRDYYSETYIPDEGEPYANSEGDAGACVFEPDMPTL